MEKKASEITMPYSLLMDLVAPIIFVWVCKPTQARIDAFCTPIRVPMIDFLTIPFELPLPRKI